MNITKLISIMAFCAILFALCSCTDVNNQNDDKDLNDQSYNENLDNENSDENSKVTLSESETNSISEKNFDMYLYSAAEDNYILNGQRTTKFDTVEYVDSKVESKKHLKINGVEYSMTYEGSAVLPTSDLAVHTYIIDGLKNARVLIDSITGNIVKYVNIPYTEALTSEEDYLDFIQKTYPSSNYSVYDYKSMTQCYYTSDSEVRSRVENGFLLENENRTTSRRYFFFTQSIDAVKTGNHISAIFDADNTFTLEIHNFDYKMDEFQSLLNSQAELENELTLYVKENLKSEYTIFDCNVVQQTLFVKDAKPYILTSVSVTFAYTDDKELSQYTTNLQLVSGAKK